MDGRSGKKKLIRDISANTLQIGIVHAFSLIIFYFTSRYLAKDDFGELNWSMAVGSTVIALASLGLDIVFVKRLASGENALVIGGIHFMHTLIVGVALNCILLVFYLVFPAFRSDHPLFFLVFINLCILNIANSLRLCLTGLEVYKYLAVVALISNVFKFAGILLLFRLGYFFIGNVIFTYVATSVLEFLLGYYFVNKSLSSRLRPVLRITQYKDFIIESLPQLAVVFFDSAMARIDWILLGIMSTATITAEYSFTYRMYESSKLPFIILAPILLTRFSRMFMQPDKIDDRSRHEIQTFFKLELFVVMLIPVTLICVWSPLIDYITDNKYGMVNTLTYVILAACVPMHCIINFLWSMGFAQGQLKVIMFITIFVTLINLLLNLFLIPLYGSVGASLSFLGATVVQTFLYAKYIRQQHIKLNLKNCCIAFLNAAVSVIVAKLVTANVIVAAALALTLLTLLAFATGQMNYTQLKKLIKP